MDEASVDLHLNVGTFPGAITDDRGKDIPVVTLMFIKDVSAIDDIEDGGIIDPYDGRWHNFSLTIRAARQLIADINESIEEATLGVFEDADYAFSSADSDIYMDDDLDDELEDFDTDELEDFDTDEFDDLDDGFDDEFDEGTE